MIGVINSGSFAPTPILIAVLTPSSSFKNVLIEKSLVFEDVLRIITTLGVIAYCDKTSGDCY